MTTGTWVVVFDCGEAAIVGPCDRDKALLTLDPRGCLPVAAHSLAECRLKKEPWVKEGMLRCDLEHVLL